MNNVRELEGAFNKVSAYADIEKKPLTLELVKQVLNCEAEKKELSIETVVNAVSEYYGVPVADFISSSRSQKVSNARHVAVYLARELTEKSFEAIAEFLRKKHPTMLYSYEKIKDELKVNKELERTVTELKTKLKEL